MKPYGYVWTSLKDGMETRFTRIYPNEFYKPFDIVPVYTHSEKEKRESEDSLSFEAPTVCNVSNPIIQKIVDSTILPFAAAYLDENGDIKEFGPYQIHFDQEFPHIKLYTAEQFELLRKAQEK